MKQLLLLPFLMAAHLTLFGQMLFSGTVAGLADSTILVERPVGGQYFPGNGEAVKLDAMGRFSVNIDGNQPGFLHLHFGQGRAIRVFVEPGAANGMTVDMADFERSLGFYGPKAVQNQYLQRLGRHQNEGIGQALPPQALHSGLDGPKALFDALENQMETEKKALRKAGKKAFSQDFLLAVELDIDYYYRSLFSAVCHYEWKAQQVQSGSLAPEWGNYWEKIFPLKNLLEGKGAVSEYYLHLLHDYVGAYKLGYMQENEFLDADMAKGEQFLEYDRILWKYFSGNTLEYSVAALFTHAASLGNNEPILAELFQKYKMDFPESAYLPLFENSIENIVVKTDETSYQFPPGIHQIGQNGEVASLQDLLGLFKGKTVYMDIWATWCSPCLFEFRQSQDLQRFAAQQDQELVLLFVSVDDDSRLEKWRKTIESHQLKGFHILANFALRDELINNYGDGSNLALPKYLIFDKKGNLVVPDAKAPSQNVLLIQQLQQYIGN